MCLFLYSVVLADNSQIVDCAFLDSSAAAVQAGADVYSRRSGCRFGSVAYSEYWAADQDEVQGQPVHRCESERWNVPKCQSGLQDEVLGRYKCCECYDAGRAQGLSMTSRDRWLAIVLRLRYDLRLE